MPTANGDWPVSAEYELDLPDNTITVYTTASKDEGRVSVDTMDSQTLENFQVRVRGKNHRTAWAKIDAISTAFNYVYKVSLAVEASGYLVYVMVNSSDPVPLGPKDTPNSKRNVMTMNCGIRARQLN